MNNIISPVDTDLIEKELVPSKFLRNTTRSGNQIYVVTAHDSPHTMREIGRLRELSFRAAGGGTGEALDIDHYDTAPIPYKQLIVWDPEQRAILGGYRFHICDETYQADPDHINVATAELFHFSSRFIEEYLPHTIELGRSFVQPALRSSAHFSRNVYALDNLWDGLGALIVRYPEKKYFLGKVTMYTKYNPEARNAILYFLRKYFADKDQLVAPRDTLQLSCEIDESKFFRLFNGNSYENDYRILFHFVKQFGEHIPPLVNSYMNLSNSMRVFGTAINPYFGDVEETGILITISDVYSEKLHRHIDTFHAIDAEII